MDPRSRDLSGLGEFWTSAPEQAGHPPPGLTVDVRAGESGTAVRATGALTSSGVETLQRALWAAAAMSDRIDLDLRGVVSAEAEALVSVRASIGQLRASGRLVRTLGSDGPQRRA